MSKLNANSIEFGSLTTAQRNALTGVANGTTIYNSSTNAIETYLGPSGWVIVRSGDGIIGASGGVLVSPNPGGYEIRHFPSTGASTFSYTSATSSATLDVVVVAGGGSGGERGGGGGGGGGVVYYPNLPLGSYTGSTSIPITVGTGGGPRRTGSGNAGGDAGTNSTFGNPSTQAPIYLVAIGGGGGRSDTYNSRNDNPTTPSGPGQQARGGSGGGQHECTGSQATDSNGFQPNTPNIPANSRTYGYGNPGGRSNPGDGSGAGCPLWGGGGGGAGGAGGGGNTGGTSGGPGGIGIGPPIISWMPASLGDGGWFGGGGGGGVHGPPSTGGSGGQGGGGAARGRSGPYGGFPGTNGTGGGGGGASVDTSSSPASDSGAGGNGIVVIRYRNAG